MVKRIFLDGRLHTFLVTDGDEDEFGEGGFPFLETLRAQAERIELLEQQNEVLQNQENALLSLLDLVSRTHDELRLEMAELKGLLGRSATKGRKKSDDAG